MTAIKPNEKIGFVGAGNIAEALIRGLIAAGVAQAKQIFAADVSAARVEAVRSRYKVHASTDNVRTAQQCHVVVLAVKPQIAEGVCREIGKGITNHQLVVSVVAGVTTGQIHEWLGGRGRIMRVMTNTPAVVLAGASAVAPGPGVTERDIRLVETMFGAVGEVVALDEQDLDAVTGLSGSGPAFVCLAVEALADGGVKAGLTREISLRLAVQTVLGTALLMKEGKEHPGVLKDKVASPAGTTIAGLHELEKGRFRGLLISAVEAATRRSRELGRR